MMSERKSLLRQVDPWVFFPSAGLCLAFVLWGVLDNDEPRRRRPTPRSAG